MAQDERERENFSDLADLTAWAVLQSTRDQSRYRQNLTRLEALLEVDAGEVRRLNDRLDESNRRATLLEEKLARIKEVRRKIDRVTNIVVTDYKHFWRLLLNDQNLDEDGVRECKVRVRACMWV